MLKDVMGIFGNIFGAKTPAQLDADAQTNLDKGFQHSLMGNYAKALKSYKLAAAHGNTDARYFIGEMHYEGQGVAQDYAEALKWYKLAADKGLADAQFKIGFMYRMGEGVAPNNSEAFKWCQLAATNGNATAQYFIGHRYYEGDGVTQDYSEALKWLKLAAPSIMTAQYDIGLMYSKGEGVEQDYIRAYMWLSFAAIKQYTPANTAREFLATKMTAEQISEAQSLLIHSRNIKQAVQSIYIKNNDGLGSDFEDGVWSYLRKDYPSAMAQLKLAAAQGNAQAQHQIGLMYNKGEGVDKNYVEAFKWSKLAAEQGIAQAQFCIGLMLRNGQGVDQNYAEALKWLNLAAAQDLLAKPSDQTPADMVIDEMRLKGQA
jgi:hypothetical protein